MKAVFGCEATEVATRPAPGRSVHRPHTRFSASPALGLPETQQKVEAAIDRPLRHRRALHDPSTELRIKQTALIYSDVKFARHEAAPDRARGLLQHELHLRPHARHPCASPSLNVSPPGSPSSSSSPPSCQPSSPACQRLRRVGRGRRRARACVFVGRVRVGAVGSRRRPGQAGEAESQVGQAQGEEQAGWEVLCRRWE